MATRGAASSRRAIAAERREAAWQLRKQGHSFRSIAERLAPEYGGNYSKSQAQRDVQHVLAEVTERTVQDAMRQRVVDVARVEDVIATWYPVAARVVFLPPEEEDAARLVPPATATGASEGEPTPEIRPVQALLDRDAAEVFLKAVDQKGKLLGYYRQEVAVYAQTPLVVASTDLSGLGEAELDAVIRNLQAALGAGDD